MLAHLRGQFAFALWDRRRRTLLLARDRMGICPLYWSRQGDWLYFASEIKGLLASGKVPAAVDPRGIDHAFTFFAMPSGRTAFQGVSSLSPAHQLKLDLAGGAEPPAIAEQAYWDLEFPDRGEEFDPADSGALVDEFRETFRRTVEIRLRADVPVVSYLSSGIDSAAVLSVASQLRDEPVAGFTIQLDSPVLDESDRAVQIAKGIGRQPTIVRCDAARLAAVYPEVIRAADSPVVDIAVSGLYCLAEEVHRQGFKVALTGEGADEALAGYPWFKIHKLLRLFDCGRFRPGEFLRRRGPRRSAASRVCQLPEDPGHDRRALRPGRPVRLGQHATPSALQPGDARATRRPYGLRRSPFRPREAGALASAESIALLRLQDHAARTAGQPARRPDCDGQLG